MCCEEGFTKLDQVCKVEFAKHHLVDNRLKM